MRHERDFHHSLNGHRFVCDPSDELSNEELGVVPYPFWVRSLVWFGIFFAGILLVVFPLLRLIGGWNVFDIARGVL